MTSMILVSEDDFGVRVLLTSAVTSSIRECACLVCDLGIFSVLCSAIIACDDDKTFSCGPSLP